MHVGMKRILIITLATLACSKTAPPVRDAGPDRSLSDAPTPASDGSVSLAIDFSVEDCPSFDALTPTCTGKTPLALHFVPMATATVTQYSWNFGDATPFDTELAPSHIYTTPGVYSVRVVVTGVGGGLVTKDHPGFIVVQANAIGEPCDATSQCDQGLFCLCSADAPCSTGPAHGLCASPCQAGSCDESAVCAGLLTATPPPGQADAWQTPMCLRECSKDADCSAGLRCRSLPPWPAGGDWIQGCFAAVPGDLGSSCMDEQGNLRNDLCASGLCTDLGANGLCSMSCDGASSSCPLGSDCAVLGDGRKLCLRSCMGNFACTQDPLLSCTVPGLGDLGYQMASPTSPGTVSIYCAPTPCTLNDPSKEDTCWPTGTCVSVTAGGHCVRRSN